MTPPGEELTPEEIAVLRSQVEAYEEQLDVMSCVIDHATGGRASKTNYTKEVYYGLIDEHVGAWMEGAAKEVREELDSQLAASQAEALRYREALELVRDNGWKTTPQAVRDIARSALTNPKPPIRGE